MASGESKRQLQTPEATSNQTFFGLWLYLRWQILQCEGEGRVKQLVLRTKSHYCIYARTFFGLYLDFHPLFGFQLDPWIGCPLALAEHQLRSWSTSNRLVIQKKCSSCIRWLASQSESKCGNANGPIEFCGEGPLLSSPYSRFTQLNPSLSCKNHSNEQ